MTELESDMDKVKHLSERIDFAITHAEVLDSIINSDSTKRLLENLHGIKRDYPVSARSFIIGQLLIENAFSEPLYLTIWDNATFKITVEQVKEIPPNKKKKWYQF